MEDKLFAELTQSISEAGAIKRGESAAYRESRFDPVDIFALREGMGLTQEELARLLGVPTATLRNWEQGRRNPRGPALALLTAVSRDPEHVLKALSH